MEELRSTEVLDREILEDARKKAFKILKTADDTLASQNRDWEKKTMEAVESIRKSYAERTKKNNDEIIARLPLDKRRLRLETAEKFLLRAMDDFLRFLKREKLLFILERKLSEYMEACSGEAAVQRAEIRYSGLSLSEAEELLEKVSVPWDCDLKEDVFAVNEFPSIIVNTQNMRITASLKTVAASLMKDNRAELASTLLGEGVLND